VKVCFRTENFEKASAMTDLYCSNPITMNF